MIFIPLNECFLTHFINSKWLPKLTLSCWKKSLPTREEERGWLKWWLKERERKRETEREKERKRERKKERKKEGDRDINTEYFLSSISIKDFVREKKSATEKKKEPLKQLFINEHQTS